MLSTDPKLMCMEVQCKPLSLLGGQFVGDHDMLSKLILMSLEVKPYLCIIKTTFENSLKFIKVYRQIPGHSNHLTFKTTLKSLGE